jgi:hypothetical protein
MKILFAYYWKIYKLQHWLCIAITANYQKKKPRCFSCLSQLVTLRSLEH